jgi:hypothetical protein
VSYEVVFLHREPGQSWEDAFAQRQSSLEDSGAVLRRLSAAEQESWERIVRRAEELLGDVEATSNDVLGELVHPGTGIEINVSAGEASITVPYRQTGEEALTVMEQLYALARIVEDETGFEGYDLPLDEPVAQARRDVPRPPGAPAQSPLGRPSPPRPTAAPPDTAAEPPSARPARQRRWWEFWRD